ncbi:KTSC domain-containing protein [Edaphobacter flagellatus]|uniref:KTSC domain-containing protein n=1 Tax=Edaphobacter flagellatus TaxID=1933044 RepID=UPI0021B3E403|nr:KTSC domain-containing protein [Edaphobacter flagellatus]
MPSSVIAAMNYDIERNALTIVYRGKRGVYRYYDVTPEEYEEFRNAPSKGTYLNVTFKARQHPYERLGPSQTLHLVNKSS